MSSIENITGKAEQGKGDNPAWSFVDKIRNIDVKWILAGTAATFGGSLGFYAVSHNSAIALAGLGVTLVGITWALRGTDLLEISPRH